jgi:transposase-like protein
LHDPRHRPPASADLGGAGFLCVHLPEPETEWKMKLIDVTKAFQSDEQCLAYLEKSRWPDGVRCPICGAKEVSTITRKTKSKNKRAQVYQCLEKTCKSQFSATNGTIFHDSHLPLSKWFMAIALLVDAKKSMSALQLSRHLGVNYRTAWYLAHRIREAMVDANAPKLTGVIEMDETYIGGKQRGHKDKKRNKDVVIGVRERGGQVRLVHTKDATADTLYTVAAQHISKNAEAIMTDENPPPTISD